jgi:hypothetical protein
MRGGYVAFLDVLGFSALVADDRDGTQLQEYLGCLTSAVDSTATKYVVFSDSIVLTVDGSEREHLLLMCSACSRLMNQLIGNNVPVRGAIAFGDFIRSAVGDGSVFVAGRAIIEAYTYEQLQDWVGVMLAPSALKQVPDLAELCRLNFQDPDGYRRAKARLPWAACVQETSNIPFRADKLSLRPTQMGFAIVPNSGSVDPSSVRDSLAEVIRRLNWMRSIAPSPADQRKYTETFQFLSGPQGYWSNLAPQVREWERADR